MVKSPIIVDGIQGATCMRASRTEARGGARGARAPLAGGPQGQCR